MNNHLLETIIEIIREVIPGLDLSSNSLEDNLQELGMNSFEFIRIVVLLEERLKIEIPDECLLISKMNTVEQMYRVLSKVIKEISGETCNESNADKTWTNGLE